MPTSIEQRAQQLGDRLGARVGPILTYEAMGDDGQRHKIRIAQFFNALVTEIDGEAWVQAEATVAASFSPQAALRDCWSIFTAEEIAASCSCGPALSAIRTNWPLIFYTLTQAGQGSVRSLIGAVATIAIETASTWLPIRELFNDPPGQFEYFENKYGAGKHPNAEQMGHTQPGDGARYFGRGFIQLTWKNSYAAMGRELGIDLVGNPDLALDASTAARIFAIYWRNRNIQAQADREDWPAVRRSVQGGSAGLDRLEAIAAALLSVARTRGLVP
jgi:hypothetical protein